MGQEASDLCAIGWLTQRWTMDHVTHALITCFVIVCEEQWHLENSTGPPVHCTEVWEELPKLQGDNVCATGDHTMVLAIRLILQDCGSRCERLQRASAWEIDLSPCHPAFCWHTAGTQLAIRVNCRNRNIRNAWRRGGVKTEKKTLALMGRRKEEVMMRPAVPMIPCVAWQEEIHQWWTGVQQSHQPQLSIWACRDQLHTSTGPSHITTNLFILRHHLINSWNNHKNNNQHFLVSFVTWSLN